MSFKTNLASAKLVFALESIIGKIFIVSQSKYEIAFGSRISKIQIDREKLCIKFTLYWSRSAIATSLINFYIFLISLILGCKGQIIEDIRNRTNICD